MLVAILLPIHVVRPPRRRRAIRGRGRSAQRAETDINTEIYVYFGTNEYNFEKLANPPTYEPTKCAQCGKVIVLSEEGYSISGGAYRCELCMAAEFHKKAGANRG